MIKIGKVQKISDDGGADRIYTYIPNVDDSETKIEERNLTFPLFPKYIQVKPKVDEFVLVFTVHDGTDETNDNIKQRFYIGPIISQPQFMKGQTDDRALAGLKIGGNSSLSRNINRLENSKGALANDDDIALYGREGTDIFLGNNDIRIRCGSRLYSSDENGAGVRFNNIDGAFIQMKYFPNDGLTVVKKIYNSNFLTGNSNYSIWESGYQTYGYNTEDAVDTITSSISLVGGDINLISTKDYSEELNRDKSNNISDDELANLIYNCHPIVYGDKLVEILGIIINAILNHVHNWGPATPCQDDYIKKLTSIKIDDMLSKNVRVS